VIDGNETRKDGSRINRPASRSSKTRDQAWPKLIVWWVASGQVFFTPAARTTHDGEYCVLSGPLVAE